MKKILSLSSQIVLISGFALIPIACSNPLIGGSNEEKPPNPPIKNIEYYQALIKETENYISDCQEGIEDIKDARNEYENEKEYQSDIDEVRAEQYSYQTLINDYQYQILLLEKENDEFSPDQVLRGITIFTEKIINLSQELILRGNLYPDPAPDEELDAILDNLKESNVLLKIFENLKGEE